MTDLIPSACLPRKALKPTLARGCLKHARLVGTNVAITVQLGVGYLTHTGFERHTPLKPRIHKIPNGTLTIGTGYHLYFQLGTIAPAMVAKHVTTLSTPSVCSLTVVRGVKGDTIYQETQMTVMVLLDNGKDGTIRGLDAIVCPSSV